MKNEEKKEQQQRYHNFCKNFFFFSLILRVFISFCKLIKENYGAVDRDTNDLKMCLLSYTLSFSFSLKLMWFVYFTIYLVEEY